MIRLPVWGEDKDRDFAFEQRDDLLVYLSRLYPSHLCLSKNYEKLNSWKWVVSIHLPEGDLMWHIADGELFKFRHLETKDNDWDGTDAEKRSERLRGIDG